MPRRRFTFGCTIWQIDSVYVDSPTALCDEHTSSSEQVNVWVGCENVQTLRWGDGIPDGGDAPVRALSGGYLQQAAGGERALFVEVLDRDLDSFIAWRSEYEAMLQLALGKPDKEAQRLGLRRLTVECLELFAVPKAYFGDEFSDRDRKALSAKCIQTSR